MQNSPAALSFTHSPINLAQTLYQPYITILANTNKSSFGKTIYYDVNTQKLAKKSGIMAGVCQATTHKISNLTTDLPIILANLKNNEALIYGWVPGTENGSPFFVYSQKHCTNIGGSNSEGLYTDQNNLIHTRWTKNNFQFSSLIMFDIDTPPSIPSHLRHTDVQDWLQKMDVIYPGFSGLTRVVQESSSNRVIDSKGNNLFTAGGLHVIVEIDSSPSQTTSLSSNTDNRDRWRHGLLVLADKANMTYLESFADGMKTKPLSIWDPVVLSSSQRVSYDSEPLVSSCSDTQDYIQGTGPHTQPHPISITSANIKTFVNSAPHQYFNTIIIPTASHDDIKQMNQKFNVNLNLSTSTNPTYGHSLHQTEPTLKLDQKLIIKNSVVSVWDLIRSSSSTNARKVRCQADWRQSTSWNAYFDVHKNGEPLVFDQGRDIKYVLSTAETIKLKQKLAQANIQGMVDEEAVRLEQEMIDQIKKSKTFNNNGTNGTRSKAQTPSATSNIISLTPELIKAGAKAHNHTTLENQASTGSKNTIDANGIPQESFPTESIGTDKNVTDSNLPPLVESNAFDDLSTGQANIKDTKNTSPGHEKVKVKVQTPKVQKGEHNPLKDETPEVSGARVREAQESEVQTLPLGNLTLPDESRSWYEINKVKLITEGLNLGTIELEQIIDKIAAVTGHPKRVITKLAKETETNIIQEAKESVGETLANKIKSIKDIAKVQQEKANLDARKEIQNKKNEETIHHLKNNYCFIKSVNKFYDLHSHTSMVPQALNQVEEGSIDLSSGKPKEIPAAAVFKQQEGESVDGLTWVPHKPVSKMQTSSNEFQYVTIASKRYCNTYCHPHADKLIEPNALSPIALYMNLMTYLMPDEEIRNVFLDHMAFTMQHPDVKINWQILFYGATRIGKDLCLRPLAWYFGDLYNDIDPDDKEGGKWGDDYAQRKVVVFQEVHRPADRAFTNSLKTKCATTGSGMTNFNLKGGNKISQRNLLSMYMMSNFPNPIHIDYDDERFFVIGAMDIKPKSSKYYTDLVNWYRKDLKDSAGNKIAGTKGVHRVAQWLLARDLSHFNPGKLPFNTEAKENVIEKSGSDIINSAREDLTHAEGIFTQDMPVVTLQMLAEYLSRKTKRKINSGILAQEMDVLKRAGLIHLDKKARRKKNKDHNESKVSLWRNPNYGGPETDADFDSPSILWILYEKARENAKGIAGMLANGF